MGISNYDVFTLVVLTVLSFLTLTVAENGVKVDVDKRAARGFNSPRVNSPFSNQNYDMVDWNDFFSNYNKNSKRGFDDAAFGGFGKSGDLSSGQFQNWNNYFARPYRSFGNIQKGLRGAGGRFGADGLQNWRAFFDNQRGRFRK